MMIWKHWRTCHHIQLTMPCAISGLVCTTIKVSTALAPWKCFIAIFQAHLNVFVTVFWNNQGHLLNCQMIWTAHHDKLGTFLDHQSNRNFPKTKFTNGIQKGKLMAKECPGILLCMAATLRCDCGIECLSGKTNFKDANVIQNWITLVETMLQWEMWLKSDKLKCNHDVKQSEKKHCCVVHLI